MKLTFLGLAFGFAVPAFAQEKDSVDAKTAEQLSALSRKTDESYNNGDAAALAALYTEDALLLTNTGPIYGSCAILQQPSAPDSQLPSAKVRHTVLDEF